MYTHFKKSINVKLKYALPGLCEKTDLKWLRTNLSVGAFNTLKTVALNHGKALNRSHFGRSMGVSYHTADRRIRALEEVNLVRRLLPLPVNSDKRLVKAPEIFVCNTGLLNRLLGIYSWENLLISPQREQIFAGYILEEIMTRARRTGRKVRAFYYGGFGSPKIDLVIDRHGERTGIVFKFETLLSKRDWLFLRHTLREKVIKNGYVLYAGKRYFFASRGILALPGPCFIDGYYAWMKDKLSLRDLHEAVSHFNRNFFSR